MTYKFPDGPLPVYVCDGCGATKEHITPEDDWVEKGIPTPDRAFDGYIGHLCPTCTIEDA